MKIESLLRKIVSAEPHRKTDLSYQRGYASGLLTAMEIVSEELSKGANEQKGCTDKS